MEVLISNDQNIAEIKQSEITALAIKIMTAVEFPDNAELSLVFCQDSAIRELNKEYRNKDEATDVLSFPLPHNDFMSFTPMSVLIGDVVISVETAKAQAEAMKHDLMQEIALLLIHGILHLKGYDHIKREDKKKMLEHETQLYEFLYPKQPEIINESSPTLIGRATKILIKKTGGKLNRDG